MLLDHLSASVAGDISDDGTISGVAVATVGPARGHGFMLSEASIDQIVKLGKKYGEVRLKIGHGTKADPDQIVNLIGYLDNFRRSGMKALADMHLTEAAAAHPRGDLRRYITAIAKETPELAGLSVEIGYDLLDDDTADIRDLFAVAVVLDPAANPNGLFSTKPINTGMKSELGTVIDTVSSSVEYTETGINTTETRETTYIDVPPVLLPLYCAADAAVRAVGTDGYGDLLRTVADVALSLIPQAQASLSAPEGATEPVAEVAPAEVAPEVVQAEEIPSPVEEAPVVDEPMAKVVELGATVASFATRLAELEAILNEDAERRAKLAAHRASLATSIPVVESIEIDHRAVWRGLLSSDPKAATSYYKQYLA